MNDLSSLMQIAPTTGAGFAGINQRNEELMSQLKQRELAELIQAKALETQQSQQMNPLKQQHQQLVNQGLQEGLGSIGAKAKDDQLKARKNQLTFESDVETAISDNKEKRGKNEENARDRATKFLLEAGPQLESVGAPMRAAAFRQMVEQAGMNVNNQQIQNMMLLAQQNPEAFPQAISAYAEKLGAQAEAMSPTARSAKAVAKTNRDSAERIAAGNNKTQLEVANIQAKSRITAAESRGKKAQDLLTHAKQGGFKTYESAAVGFKILADLAEDEDERAKYLKAAQQFEAAVKEKPNTGAKPDLSELGVPVKKAVSSFDEGGSVPKASQKHSLSDVQKMYPGVPPEKIREAYKKKFGVDLQ
jgi:hypothetical protein